MLWEMPFTDPVAVWHVANKTLLVNKVELLVLFEKIVGIPKVYMPPCDLAGLWVDAFCFFATPLQERLRFCGAKAALRLEVDDVLLTGIGIRPPDMRYG